MAIQRISYYEPKSGQVKTKYESQNRISGESKESMAPIQVELQKIFGSHEIIKRRKVTLDMKVVDRMPKL